MLHFVLFYRHQNFPIPNLHSRQMHPYLKNRKIYFATSFAFTTFAPSAGRNLWIARKHFAWYLKTEIRQNSSKGQKRTMLILFCIYVWNGWTNCIPIAYCKMAWEYCFFHVHFVRAFGDASFPWTQGNKSHAFFVSVNHQQKECITADFGDL